MVPQRHSLTHPLTHSPTHSLTHSLTPSLPPPTHSRKLTKAHESSRRLTKARSLLSLTHSLTPASTFNSQKAVIFTYVDPGSTRANAQPAGRSPAVAFLPKNAKKKNKKNEAQQHTKKNKNKTEKSQKKKERERDQADQQRYRKAGAKARSEQVVDWKKRLKTERSLLVLHSLTHSLTKAHSRKLTKAYSLLRSCAMPRLQRHTADDAAARARQNPLVGLLRTQTPQQRKKKKRRGSTPTEPAFHKKPRLEPPGKAACESTHAATPRQQQQLPPPKLSRWDEQFERLLEFVARNGHARVPKSYRANPSLGCWVSAQRVAYRAAEARQQGKRPRCSVRISAAQIAKLESVGFIWHAGKASRNAAWEAMFNRLLDFVEQTGHTRVPYTYPADPALGAWVSLQRQAYRFEKERKQGKPPGDNSRISATEIAKLDSLRFVWHVGTAWSNIAWEEKFSELLDFVERNGHAAVPSNCATHPSLGEWAHQQREAYRGGQTRSKAKQASTQCRISAARFAKLDSVGFVWQLRTTRSRAWEEQFAKLLEFVERNGHALVPNTCTADPSLGQWVVTQRQAYRGEQDRKQGKQPRCDHRISAARIAKLDSVGFVWHPEASQSNVQWEARFDQLLEFVEQNGHAAVPRKYAADPSFGKWVGTQRQAYRGEQARKQGKQPRCSTRISAARVAKLDSVEFVWVSTADKASWRNARWEARFDQLLEFVEQNGHAAVPRKYVADPSFGEWVAAQRRAYRGEQARKQGKQPRWSGRISSARVAKLNSIGFVWHCKTSDRSARRA